MQGDGGQSVGSGTDWEYFWLALHVGCALGMRDEAENTQTNSVQRSHSLGVPSAFVLACLSPFPAQLHLTKAHSYDDI